MIKVLKLSNKSVRRFKTNKKWKYSSLDTSNSLILEQGDNIPLFIDSTNQLATEQNVSEFNLNIRYGKKISGTFFPEGSKYYDKLKEPINYDGTYHRVVYNSVKHLFYNDYNTTQSPSSNEIIRNPLNLFGGESGNYTSSKYKSTLLDINDKGEYRILNDEVTLLEIPGEIFGEKIKPGSLRITDYSSPYESIEIVDDGNTNLVVGSRSFNEISELRLGPSFKSVTQTTSTDDLNINYSDMSFGYSVESYGNYLFVGAPVLESSPSDLQTGRATLHKYNLNNKKFEVLKEFYCPFTQNGYSQENTNDNCSFILTELGDILSNEKTSINDNFGKTIAIEQNICAIGSPSSHITGETNEQPTGHLFIYDKNKGGEDNWGLINVFEGEPDSEFGASISIEDEYIVVGSPNHNNGKGVVYIFKKTKRTKSHPWIKTSQINSLYEWNDILKKYDGLPIQNDDDYLKYLKDRDTIVSRRIDSLVRELKKLKDSGIISKTEYVENIPSKDDFSEIYPYNYLYAHTGDCDGANQPWYIKKYWSKEVHPYLRCTEVQNDKYFKKSVWPGYILDEELDLYIPNPNHEQNKNNKWAYRWKIQNVAGGGESLSAMGQLNECDDTSIKLFSDDIVSSFGDDSGYPLVEYSESPDSSIGDTTYDLIGTILPPTEQTRRFGENVVIKKNKIFVTNPSSLNPSCFYFNKKINEHGCEQWKLVNTVTDSQIVGHLSEKQIDSSTLNSIDIRKYDTFIDVSICPTTQKFSEWVYKLNEPILDSERNIVGGTRMSRCESLCEPHKNIYKVNLKRIYDKNVGQIPANSGDSKKLSTIADADAIRKYNIDENSKFYSKSQLEDSFYHADENSIGLSWKNMRENVSFMYTNVNSGTQPSFMSIYWNNAKLKNGKYDPLGMICEIGAQETLNNQIVRLILNVGMGEDHEIFYEFKFMGSIEGRHFTLDELKTEFDYENIIAPNTGSMVSLSNINFNDPLDNKSNARFFTKNKSGISNKNNFFDKETECVSWKNFRENVSFSYPSFEKTSSPAFMTIYADTAKTHNGEYDPMHTIAEIGAYDSLNGKRVRLTLNTGFINGDEINYNFIFKGSLSGTHWTLSELRDKFDYQCTLQPNKGIFKIINNKNFKDPLNSKKAVHYSKNKKSDTSFDLENEEEVALGWENVRENVSFSYPKLNKSGEQVHMAVYFDEAINKDGSLDKRYCIAEINAPSSLNGKMVRLVLNHGFQGGDEYFYDFIFLGTTDGSHYTLNRLKTKYDDEIAEFEGNVGDIRLIKTEKQDLYKTCQSAKFYTKSETDLSFLPVNSSETDLGISWKNFRENISFSYPKIRNGSHPSFMSIYSNEAKKADGKYDPIYLLAEIGAWDTLNGKTVSLIFNSDGCYTKESYKYDFIYKGSIEGTHYTLNELSDEIIFDCTLPPNMGEVSLLNLKDFDDYLDNTKNARFYTKHDSGLSYVRPFNNSNEMALSWKNFRENVSFSYPSVERGIQPSFMTIYSNTAKRTDGTYDPMQILAEVGAQNTLNGKMVRITFNSGFVGGDEYYYDFIYMGSIEGTHYTLNELKEEIQYENTLPPNQGATVKLSSNISVDPLGNLQNGLLFSNSNSKFLYNSNKNKHDLGGIDWKNFRENVSFSYPNFEKSDDKLKMSLYFNEAKRRNGTYDENLLIGEIIAHGKLNDKQVRITLNSGFENGDEYYYEFLYNGSENGTHFTLNELKDKNEYDCVFYGNSGSSVFINNIDFNDFLQNKTDARFYTKKEEQVSYTYSGDENEMAISWKNFRENVSFSYPKLTSSDSPVFMTIYSNNGKDENGNYDPIYTLAEIGADDVLNNKQVRLTFNTGSVGDDEFYYEFKFNGSLSGSHFTLNELDNAGLLIRVDQTQKLKYTKSKKIEKKISKKLKKHKVNLVKKQFTDKLKPIVSPKIKKYKSHGSIIPNYGSVLNLDNKNIDDIIDSDSLRFYSSGNNRLHSINTKLFDEIEIGWQNVRQNVRITYPSIIDMSPKKNTMRIYADHPRDDINVYNKTYCLAEITTSESLNEEIIRLTLNEGSEKEMFYDFLFNGSETGTDYTISELVDSVSKFNNLPLLVDSSELAKCSVKIKNESINVGYQKLYFVLIDNIGNPIGEQSFVEFYNNPVFYRTQSRESIVKKSYYYDKPKKTEFGYSIDASETHLMIGNPVDRFYSEKNDTREVLSAGSVFVFEITDDELNFIEKLYGNDQHEEAFTNRFGCDVSVLGSNFVVGSYATEMSNMYLVENGSETNLEIDDFEYGARKYTDEVYHTREALITDYKYTHETDLGDVILKVKVGDMKINTELLSEIDIRADFIDTGLDTLRVSGLKGKQLENVNGVYTLVKNPISVTDDCNLSQDGVGNVYVNKNNFSIFYDTTRMRWILSDTPFLSSDFDKTEEWSRLLLLFEKINKIHEYDKLTPDSIEDVLKLYGINDQTYYNEWLNKANKSVSLNKIKLVDFLRNIETVKPLDVTMENVNKLIRFYSTNARRRIDTEIVQRWEREYTSASSILPLVFELDSVNHIFLNYDMMLKILIDLYKIEDIDVIRSWSLKLGYEFLLGDLLSEIRPRYTDKLNKLNLFILNKIINEIIFYTDNNTNITNLVTTEFYFKTSELKKYIAKWNKIRTDGFIIGDVYNDISSQTNINFAVAHESSDTETPMMFSAGVGYFHNKKIKINLNNDNVGDNNSLTWGVYRDKTKIIDNEVWIYVNVLENVEFTDTIVFIYNTIKNSVNGRVYYYNIENNLCKKIKSIKTNKIKYSPRKQYGYNVSLSSNFISVGSPVLGEFNIDEIITFAGNSVSSFSKSETIYLDYKEIEPKYLKDVSKNIVGSVMSYDHSALRDNKKQYIGNIFYKNGVISITDRGGYLQNIVKNSGDSGFEVEFKSSQTLYENEIVCKVEPHEFNFSTNPTSVSGGSIIFDINEDGKFDINDVSYIFKYILGMLDITEIDRDALLESNLSIKTEQIENSSSNDLVLTESEDVILMDLFFNSDILEVSGDREKAIGKLKRLYDAGEFDIDGDGITSENDAKLLVRYFAGRTGEKLTKNLINKYGNATRTKSIDITNYLDEKTGKNIGRKILGDFIDFEEKEKNDKQGSYLAPFATTIGLYSGLDLVMVAKLGKPVKILPNYPINFLIKFDA